MHTNRSVKVSTQSLVENWEYINFQIGFFFHNTSQKRYWISHLNQLGLNSRIHFQLSFSLKLEHLKQTNYPGSWQYFYRELSNSIYGLNKSYTYVVFIHMGRQTPKWFPQMKQNNQLRFFRYLNPWFQGSWA